MVHTERMEPPPDGARPMRRITRWPIRSNDTRDAMVWGPPIWLRRRLNWQWPILNTMLLINGCPRGQLYWTEGVGGGGVGGQEGNLTALMDGRLLCALDDIATGSLAISSWRHSEFRSFFGTQTHYRHIVGIERQMNRVSWLTALETGWRSDSETVICSFDAKRLKTRGMRNEKMIRSFFSLLFHYWHDGFDQIRDCVLLLPRHTLSSSSEWLSNFQMSVLFACFDWRSFFLSF